MNSSRMRRGSSRRAVVISSMIAGIAICSCIGAGETIAQAIGSEYEPYEGARWILPCGGPCTTVALIERLDRYPEQNVVRALAVFSSPQGTRKEWWFAYCDREVLGEWGFASDASDTRLNEVYYYPFGLKEEWDGGSTANRFSRWRALCSSR